MDSPLARTASMLSVSTWFKMKNVFPPSGFLAFGPSCRHRRCSIVEVGRDRSAVCRSLPCSSLRVDPFRLPCVNGCRSLLFPICFFGFIGRK